MKMGDNDVIFYEFPEFLEPRMGKYIDIGIYVNVARSVVRSGIELRINIEM
jgi:hypothetical protein